MLMLASGTCFAASTAAVSGVVRDAEGVAQMGAMVEVLAAGSVSVATAFTDMNGRYRIANLLPGRYQVRATAALFVPAMRRNLQLGNGMRATVNLTLNMLSDPASWLPAERRKPDEPKDDWTWTLRSAVNRPILRMLGDGEVVTVSAGGQEGAGRAPIVARAEVAGGDGGFGAGGVHTVVALEQTTAAGSAVVIRTDLAPGNLNGRGPGAELDAGYEHTTAFMGATRMVANYATHPEMMSAGGAAGMQAMRMASARRMQLGDAVDVEAGGTVYAIHTSGTALTAQPFVQVTVHPGEVWAVRYRLATSRDLEDYDGLDSIAEDLPVTAMSGGRMCTERGTHQELGASRKVGPGSLHTAVYHDSIGRSALAGTGMPEAEDMAAGAVSSEVVVDTATDSFRLLGAGYATDGVTVSLSEPVAHGWWAAVEYGRGAALAMQGPTEGLAQAVSALRTEAAAEVAASLKGEVARTGTRVRVSYRVQPQRMVTTVAPYEAAGGQGYLSFYVRQSMRWGDLLPPGLEATIDVTNLLAQGYQPFLSADGRTLFLAQAPRTVQGGLSFTF